jgi:hypothetical protein
MISVPDPPRYLPGTIFLSPEYVDVFPVHRINSTAILLPDSHHRGTSFKCPIAAYNKLLGIAFNTSFNMFESAFEQLPQSLTPLN